MSHPIGRSIAVFTLGLALTLPWSAAAAPRAGLRGARPAPAVQPSPPGLAGQLWTFLVSLWAEEGCILDPSGCSASQNGGLAPGGPAPEGCIADPNGFCAAAMAPSQPVDAGCILDPSGCR